MAELFDYLAGRTRFTHFLQYLMAFCSRLEAANNVTNGKFVRPIVTGKCAKCADLRLNCSREIRPGAVGRRHFRPFLRDNFRPEVGS